MKKVLYMVICLVLMMPLGLTAYAVNNDDETTINTSTYSPGNLSANYVKNTSQTLTDEQAEVIFEDIKEQILSKYGNVYKCDNFSGEFVNEKIENDKVSIDVNVNFDMTLIRHPADSPYVKGMQTALSKAKGEQEKEIAQKEIDDFLKETEPYYNSPSPTSILYRIELENDTLTQDESTKSLNNDIPYKLFYRADITSEETILTPVKTSEKLEDESLLEENGEKAINDAINGNMHINEMETISTVTYNRLAARDYARAHALDKPEFSEENGMGSDCANFVSKSIHAGDNWMRTGYYNNGGVVPYMANKGYFCKKLMKAKFLLGVYYIE